MARRKDHNGRVLPDGVTERADGRYLYRYNQYGKTHYLYAKDLTEIKQKIAQLKTDVVKGRNVDLAKLTLNEWYPQYLELYKRGKIKDASFLNLERYYNWYIQPYDVGRMPMRELKRVKLVAHFQWLADNKGLSHGTLRSLDSMVFNALQQIVFDEGLFVNPATAIMKDVSSRPQEVREALTHEQVDALVRCLKADGFQSVYFPMIGVMLGTGLRFGECDGLTWADVDMNNRVINVNKTLNYRTRKNGEGHEFYLTSPKTPNAYRQIEMSDDVYRLFQMQKQYQKDLRIRNDNKIKLLGKNDEDLGECSDFVFTTKLGWPFTHEGFVKSLRRIYKVCNEMETGLATKENRTPALIPEKITPHCFRHTFCTFMVEDMVRTGRKDYEKIKILMGHSSIQTSIDIYTTINKELSKQSWKEAADIIKFF